MNPPFCRIVLISGAGISVESGIQPFRQADDDVSETGKYINNILILKFSLMNRVFFFFLH